MAKKIVLAVDDMPEALGSITAALNNKYDVRSANSAAAAREALKAITPDIILLDIEMPDVSGLDFFKELQADAKLKTTPIVFLTANSEEDIAQKAIQQGAKGYIIKPFTSESLLESLAFFL